MGAFDAVVARPSGVGGRLVVDAERASAVRWTPGDGELDRFEAEGGESGWCGGCLTWDGAQALPLEVAREDLVGALPSTSAARPSFEILHSTTTRKGRRKIVRTDPFLCATEAEAEACVAAIRRASGLSRGRKRVMVVLNPVSGKGAGSTHWSAVVKPALDAAGIEHDLFRTGASGDAEACARDVDADVHDAFAIIGGDGTLHEAIQGLFDGRDPREARKVAFAVIPTGSGNGFAASIGNVDVQTATWCLLRNERAPMDVVSIVQPSQPGRRLMCLTTTFGFIADLDLDTEHLRCLGQARFTIGAAYQILMGRTTRAAVAYVPRDYHSEEGQVGAGGLASRHEGEFTEISCPLLEAVPGKFDPGLDLSALPAPWRALEREDFQLFVAANVACMSMGDRVAPTQDPSSRHLSLVCTHRNSRWRNVRLMDSVETGTTHEDPVVTYLDCAAFAIDPKSHRLQFSLDGERVPTERLFGEIHPGLGTFVCNAPPL